MACRGRPTIVHVLHSLEGGGTERTLVRLLRSFDPTRFRHVVVTLREAGTLTSQLPDHVAVRPLHCAGRSWTAGFRLWNVARAFGADAIHARNTCCWADATLAGMLLPRTRLFLGFHGLEGAKPFSLRQRRLARWALRTGGSFTSVSEAGCRKLCEETAVPRGRVDLLRNGVDLSRFHGQPEAIRSGLRATFRFDRRAFVVGTVGSLTPVKEHRVLIQALSRLLRSAPHVRLLIVGDGPLRASLERQVQVAGLEDQVCFTGWREDVPGLLASMDAYVCCSGSEEMNNALLEAMAAGLPVVTTDVGDHGIIIRDNVEGFVVRPGSPSRIADALARLVRRSAEPERFGRAARARAQEYDFDRTVRAYEAYYERKISARASQSDLVAAKQP